MIDKTKAYRFRGDSERWEWTPDGNFIFTGNGLRLIAINVVESHISRGILLEYPELPGEDWEFCGEDDDECKWCDETMSWNYTDVTCSSCTDIYCRKKKPVYRSGCCTIIERTLSGQPFPDEVPIYWTTDPVRGKELLK